MQRLYNLATTRPVGAQPIFPQRAKSLQPCAALWTRRCHECPNAQASGRSGGKLETTGQRRIVRRLELPDKTFTPPTRSASEGLGLPSLALRVGVAPAGASGWGGVWPRILTLPARQEWLPKRLNLRHPLEFGF